MEARARPSRPIRLLVSDVDGTLVTKDKVVTPAARDAAAALAQAGIGLALTSSRPPFGMRMMVEPLRLVLPIAGCNGGVWVEPDMSVTETNLIDADAAGEIAAFIRDSGLDLWVYTERDWHVPDAHGPHVERETFILQQDPVVGGELKDALRQAVKIVGVSDNHDRVAEVEAKAQARFGDRVSATRSERHFLDVTNPRANKGEVVETLSRRLSIPTAEIATIGDMPNDVLMFARSGFSVAMGNASDAVKAKATSTTLTNAEDGWAQAVRDLILPAAPGRS